MTAMSDAERREFEEWFAHYITSEGEELLCRESAERAWQAALTQPVQGEAMCMPEVLYDAEYVGDLAEELAEIGTSRFMDDGRVSKQSAQAMRERARTKCANASVYLKMLSDWMLNNPNRQSPPPVAITREQIATLKALFNACSCPECGDKSGIYNGNDGEPCQCRWCFDMNGILTELQAQTKEPKP